MPMSKSQKILASHTRAATLFFYSRFFMELDISPFRINCPCAGRHLLFFVSPKKSMQKKGESSADCLKPLERNLFKHKNMPKNVCVLVNISLLKQSVAAPLFIINSLDLLNSHLTVSPVEYP
jgi:hypothetical protein